MDEEKKKWERMPGERDVAWGAFCSYRDMGTSRTKSQAYRRYCEKTGKTPSRQVPGHWYTWAERYDWEGRIRAWDNEIEREALEQAKHRMTESREQSGQMVRALLGRLVPLLQGSQDAPPDVRELHLLSNMVISLGQERERLIGLEIQDRTIGDPTTIDIHWHVHRG